MLLDGLRGLAAVAIVVHHFTSNGGHREVFASAAIAVDFFFCVSGFVIAHAYHDRLMGGMSVAEFALRRLKRLYPLYLVGAVAGLVAVLALRVRGMTDLDGGSIAIAFLLNLGYLPYFNDGHVRVFDSDLVGTLFPFNNPAWSLFFGLLANLLYAAGIRRFRNATFAWMGASAIGVCVAAAVYGEAPGWGTGNFAGGFPRVLYAFFAGIAVFQFGSRFAAFRHVGSAGVAVLVVALFAVPRFAGHLYYWLLGCLVLVPLLVAASSACRIDERSLIGRLCALSGRLSYAIFCVHYPVMMMFSAVVAPDPYYLVVASAYLGATLAFAYLAMRFAEAPLREWLYARVAAR